MIMMRFNGEMLRATIDGEERLFSILGSVSPKEGETVYAVTPDVDAIEGGSGKDSISFFFVEPLGEGQEGTYTLVSDKERQATCYSLFIGS